MGSTGWSGGRGKAREVWVKAFMVVSVERMGKATQADLRFASLNNSRLWGVWIVLNCSIPSPEVIGGWGVGEWLGT